MKSSGKAKSELSLKKGIVYILMAAICMLMLKFSEGIIIERLIYPIFGYRSVGDRIFGAVVTEALVCSVVWILVIFVIVKIIQKIDSLSEIFSFKFQGKSTIIGILMTIIFIGVYGYIQYLSVGKGATYKTQIGLFVLSVMDWYGGWRGVLVSVTNILCRLVNCGMSLMMIVCFQRGVEYLIRGKYVPYGAITMMYIWGATPIKTVVVDALLAAKREEQLSFKLVEAIVAPAIVPILAPLWIFYTYVVSKKNIICIYLMLLATLLL